jgi:hypothetical protein
MSAEAVGIGLLILWVGMFIQYCFEWDRKASLRSELRQSYREADELRSILYATSGAEIRHLDTHLGDCA